MGIIDKVDTFVFGKSTTERIHNLHIEDIIRKFNIRGEVTFASYDYKKKLLKVNVK